MEILSVLYLLVYVFSGIMISRYVFATDKPLRRIFFGLVFGLAMLLWFPVLFAFLLDFTLGVQLLAAGAAVLLGVVFAYLANRKQKRSSFNINNEKITGLKPLLWTAVPLLIVGWVLIINHNIVPASNGSLHSGQSTFGDTCMHLGFITSISVQQTFPPDYSLLPGTAMGYPFLCDSISSTFYTLGSSLRFAAILPSLYAYLVVVLGVYFFFESWFKKSNVTVLATYMFFIGGGFGFAYTFNNQQLLAAQGIDRWEELLTGFYQAPTNIPAEGLRWVNAIADMLVPQRASLFGWALLFPCLQLLHRAAIQRESKLFIPLGILAGCMPLVHTHSFVAVGLIAIFLLVVTLRQELLSKVEHGRDTILVHALGIFAMLLISAVVCNYVSKSGNGWAGNYIMLGIGAFGLFQLGWLMAAELNRMKKGKNYLITVVVSVLCLLLIIGIVLSLTIGSSDGMLSATGIFLAVLSLLACLAAIVVIMKRNAKRMDPDARSIPYFKQDNGKHILMFIIFGVIAVLLAAPQLFGFTFKQASNDQFLRWQFNWDNESDSWLWFYIKNLGLIFLFMIPAFISTKKDSRVFYGGALLIWFICEIMLFQPNPYDNNKLLFVWFALTCGIVAEFLVSIYKSLNKSVQSLGTGRSRKLLANKFIALMVLVAIFLSGSLTLVREYISGDHWGTDTNPDGSTSFGYIESGYEVVSADLLKMTEWVKDNTKPNATFLTHNNHNNAIAMLTGRNIFVGSGTFLNFHGVDYRGREAMLKGLYENPNVNLQITANQYGIDYVLISNYERGNYSVDTEWFEANLECVYSQGMIRIYGIK